MNVFGAAGVALIGIFGFLLLRSTSSVAFLLPLGALVLLLVGTVPQLLEILRVVQDLGTDAGLDFSAVSTVLRGLGIALITRFASGVCLDCGQRGLAEGVDYFGQVAILSLALPSLLALTEKITDL